jgi:hypothetical protein
MAGPRTPISRPMVLLSAGAVSAAIVVAVYAVVRGAAPSTVAPGRCDVTATVSVTTDAAERPVAVARDAYFSWALLVSPKAGRVDGSVRVRVVRVPDEGAPAVIYTGDAPAADAVAGFARGPAGVAFAIARGRAVTAYVVTPEGAVREHAFPRGESPPGRDALTPSLSLSAEPDGTLTALARWPAPYGAQRIHTRDVRESEAYTPRRPDAFRAPDLAVVGDAVLLAQERLAGSFRGAPARPAVELVVMDAAPAHPDTRAALTLAPAGERPRVAPLDPAAGAVVVWRDAQGLAASQALRGDAGWRAGEPLRLSDAVTENVTGDHDVASARACGAVAAWRDGASVVARAFDLARSRRGEPARVEAPVGERVAGEAARVRVERVGDRTLVAVDTAAGPRVYDATADEACAVTLRAVALPAAASAAGMRVVGLAAGASAAVLAVTAAPSDAAASAMVYATIPAATAQPARLAPPAATAQQGASALAMLAGDVPVLVGRARASVMLLRVGDAADRDEPGEDLLLRAVRGEDVAVTASAALHRVWVADVSGDEDTGFGAPRSVVVHSAIDTLEDGPRTEVRPAAVPRADYARTTLTALAGAGDAAWGVTASAGAGDDCAPGAWASLRTVADALIGPAVSLVTEGEPACADQVLAASWAGAHLAATVLGERAGVRLVTGDVRTGAVRGQPLDTRTNARPRMAAVARAQRGLLALWLDGDALSPSLRYRMFTRDGAPRTDVVTLGEVTAAPGDVRPGDALLLDGEGGRYVTVLRTVHGPRLARLSCGAVP